MSEKKAKGAVRVVLWGELKKKPPEQLKISSIGVTPHKWWMYRAILDSAYRLQLSTQEVVHLVNKATTKTAPRGVIDQLGHSLSRIIHAFAEADEGVKGFMAK